MFSLCNVYVEPETIKEKVNEAVTTLRAQRPAHWQDHWEQVIRAQLGAVLKRWVPKLNDGYGGTVEVSFWGMGWDSERQHRSQLCLRADPGPGEELLNHSIFLSETS